MQRQTAGTNEVPIEADAIGLFLPENEPSASRARRPSSRPAPTGSTIFEVVPVGDVTNRVSEWQPPPPAVPAVDAPQPVEVDWIGRAASRLGEGVVFLISLPLRGALAVCAAVATIAFLPVRAFRFVRARLRLRSASVRASMLARKRSLRLALRAGWLRVVAVAFLPVRAWGVATTRISLGMARIRTWTVRTKTRATRATASVHALSAQRAHELASGAARFEASTRRSLTDAGHSIEHGASIGRAQATALALQATHGVAVIHDRARAASRTLAGVASAGNAAVWRSLAVTGRSLREGARLLAEDVGLAWLLTASTIAFFAIGSLHQPERRVVRAAVAPGLAVVEGLGVAAQPVAPAAPQPREALVQVVAAVAANPERVAPAVASLSTRPSEPVREPKAIVATAAPPVAARPVITRSTGSTAVVVDGPSVPMIWGGVDVRTLQERLPALAKQNVESSRCEVSRSTTTRAKAVCTGLLASAAQPGNEGDRPRTRSWTIDLQQAEDRWQIVKVAAR